MDSQQSRRRFLQLLSAGAASLVLPAFIARTAYAAEDAPIKMWTTDGGMKLASHEPISWASGPAAGNTIALDPGKRFQQILGFGGAFTDAACYEFNTLSAGTRASVFAELFGQAPGALNLNVCRTCIGSSDYSTVIYSYDDGDPDPELKRFSIEHDKQWILPILREARKTNPELFLFSTPWSPPGWMKPNNSMLGGNMRQKYMDVYARYFVKFLRAYEAEGIPIQAVSIQNEPDTDQDGRMAACSWPQEYEQGFVKNHLGPTFAKEGLKTKIWIIDHNYNLWGRAVCELEDAEMRKYVDGVAWHGYLGTPDWMMKVHDAQPDINMYWTEGGPDVTSKDYTTDWVNWSRTFTGIMRNWCRSITVWNLALDEDGKPNIGPFPCGGLVTVTKQGGIVRSGQYYALAHFSSHIKRGAYRIQSQGDLPDISHVAFETSHWATKRHQSNSQRALLQL